jgi:hypothetical protein
MSLPCSGCWICSVRRESSHSGRHVAKPRRRNAYRSDALFTFAKNERWRLQQWSTICRLSVAFYAAI